MGSNVSWPAMKCFMQSSPSKHDLELTHGNATFNDKAERDTVRS